VTGASHHAWVKIASVSLKQEARATPQPGFAPHQATRLPNPPARKQRSSSSSAQRRPRIRVARVLPKPRIKRLDICGEKSCFGVLGFSTSTESARHAEGSSLRHSGCLLPRRSLGSSVVKPHLNRFVGEQDTKSRQRRVRSSPQRRHREQSWKL